MSKEQNRWSQSGNLYYRFDDGKIIRMDGQIIAPRNGYYAELLELISAEHNRVHWKSWFGKLLCYIMTGHRNILCMSDKEILRYVCRNCGHSVSLP
jgi:fibrillarin-like rRNA methylase